jgi:hypothetical protein
VERVGTIVRTANVLVACFSVLRGSWLLATGTSSPCALTGMPTSIVRLVGAGLVTGGVLLVVRRSRRLGLVLLIGWILLWAVLSTSVGSATRPCPEPHLLLGILFLLVFASAGREGRPGLRFNPVLFLILALTQLAAGVLGCWGGLEGRTKALKPCNSDMAAVRAADTLPPDRSPSRSGKRRGS